MQLNSLLDFNGYVNLKIKLNLQGHKHTKINKQIHEYFAQHFLDHTEVKHLHIKSGRMQQFSDCW